MRYSLLALVFLTGCTGFTGVGVAEKLSAERTQRYQMSVEAHDVAVKHVMDTLSKVDRGGMKIETTEDGRIKAISYTDKLDMNIIAKALETPQYKEEKVQSILSEVGDFMLKATNMIVPVASIYYGSKNHIATTQSQTAMNASNNEAQTNMIGSYTGNFNNVSSDVRTTNTTTLTDTSTASDNSSTAITNTQLVPNIAIETNSTRIY